MIILAVKHLRIYSSLNVSLFSDEKKIDVHVMKYNYKYDFIFTVDDQLIFIPCVCVYIYCVHIDF